MNILKSYHYLKEIQNELKCATITITCSIIEESENLHSINFLFLSNYLLSWY